MLSKICSGRKANISNNNDLSKRAILMQIFISFLANLSVLSPKMGLGFPAILSLLMIKDETLTKEQVSWFASIITIACPFGGVLAAFCCDRIGRKPTIIVTDIISIIQWAMIAFSSESDSKLLFAELIIARVLTGISIAILACVTPSVVYLSEICHPRICGSLLILSTFMLAVGTFIIYIIENFILDFRLASIYALSIIIFSTIACFFVPETPVYLVTKNKLNEARKALSMLHNVYKYDSKIDDEIRQIQEIRLSSSTNDESKSSAFMVIQQISGIHVIYIFAAQFVQEADVTIDEFVATAIIGIIRCVGTLLVGFISDITGRKTLLFIFCLIGTVGVLTLSFTMVGEVFPQKTKGLGVRISLSFAFFLSFFTIKTFSLFFEVFGSAILFTFYALISLLGIFFSIFILPETKGKTLQQNENYFRK